MGRWLSHSTEKASLSVSSQNFLEGLRKTMKTLNIVGFPEMNMKQECRPVNQALGQLIGLNY
jgi:hypothetical protein